MSLEIFTMKKSEIIELTSMPGLLGAGFMFFLTMLGLQLFFEIGSPKSILYSLLIFIVLSKLLTVQLKGEDIALFGGSTIMSVAIFSIFIFVSAPIWDESGYCSKQTSAEIRNVGPQSLADVFNQKSRSDIYISSGRKECLETGAWKYSSGFQKLVTWVSGLLALLGVGFHVLYNGFIYLGNNADRFSWIFDLSSRKDDKPWEGADYMDATDTRRIKMMSAILDRLKIEFQKGTRALIGEFERWSPSHKVERLSDNHLSELKELYIDLIEFIPSTYTEKEVKKGTLERRIKKVKDEFSKIEAEMQARQK